MKLTEEDKNLFEVNNYVKQPYVLAFTTSADLIFNPVAKEFDNRFSIKSLVKEHYEGLVGSYNGGIITPIENVQIGNFKTTVYPLIVKRFNFHQSPSEVLKTAMELLRDDMLQHSHKRLALPPLDEWDDYKEIIKSVFQNTQITIKICNKH